MNALAVPYQQTNDEKKLMMQRINTARMHEVLLRIGVPPHLYGYEYIIHAVELIIQEPDLLHHVTKGLYIDVALHFRTNPSRVERAIRHAINVTWSYGDAALINEIFKNSTRIDKCVPTNTMFLARLYHYINNHEYE